MNNYLFRKSLICAILLFFIILNITPGLSVNNDEINNQLPSSYILNNDYVNAYWEFDEGSGNIAYDSSQHNYDGEINGATWTAGYYNYALDFDGIADYVSVDAYSENLGFNRTDDLIFSLWFNSTMTNGLIYSMSDSLGILLAELNLGLNNQGNVLIEMYFTGCGITVISEDAYNDGQWHYIKIYYHGSTAKSKVDLYIDNVFDSNSTDSLCNFEAKEFKRAKIGKRATGSTKHFGGLIDDFKIIKYPGGNKQVPPIIDGPSVGETGVEYEFLFITNDPEEDMLEILIDWDDGTQTGWIGPYESGKEIIVSHTWDIDGKYDIKAKSMDFWDDSSWSEPYVIGIGNQPPNTPNINGPSGGAPEVEYDYTFVTDDPEGDDVFYEIDWDDESNDYFGPINSGTEIIVNHSWAEEGTYIIEARAKDLFGTYSDWEQLEVIIPRSKIINNFFLSDILERFPLLIRLLSLIGAI